MRIRANRRISDPLWGCKTVTMSSPSHKGLGLTKRVYQYVKMHKFQVSVLDNHTILLHVAQDFDILRNAYEKNIENLTKVYYNKKTEC